MAATDSLSLFVKKNGDALMFSVPGIDHLKAGIPRQDDVRALQWYAARRFSSKLQKEEV
jgi:hypothetical protein